MVLLEEPHDELLELPAVLFELPEKLFDDPPKDFLEEPEKPPKLFEDERAPEKPFASTIPTCENKKTAINIKIDIFCFTLLPPSIIGAELLPQ